MVVTKTTSWHALRGNSHASHGFNDI